MANGNIRKDSKIAEIAIEAWFEQWKNDNIGRNSLFKSFSIETSGDQITFKLSTKPVDTNDPTKLFRRQLALTNSDELVADSSSPSSEEASDVV